MKRLSSIVVAIVYLLTLITQLPHIYSVYSALERDQRTIFGVNTALGAAVAFEASVALFTWRIINNRRAERSRWTRPGVVGFLVISAIANVSYYFDFAWLDAYAMPAILSVALPVALWLYSEEYGTEARAAIRQQRRSEPRTIPKRHTIRCDIVGCDWAGRSDGYDTATGARNALSGHGRRHHG